MADVREQRVDGRKKESARISEERLSMGRRRLATGLLLLAVFVVVLGVSALWLWAKASIIHKELNAAANLISPLKETVSRQDTPGAVAIVDQLVTHTRMAKSAAEDPVWTLAASVPGVGQNFSAVSEMAQSADDVANLGLKPLAGVFDRLHWESVIPSKDGAELAPIAEASSTVASAAHAVTSSGERLKQIDSNYLIPEIADPLNKAETQLEEVAGTLEAAADASRLLPGMLGGTTPRNYLVMVQNNAESRASGGIPGALAVVTVDQGKLNLTAQSSAGALGVMAPVIPTDSGQRQIYSARLGKFMQDVNMTPDFPTAASTAQAMWEQKMGQRLDGVISVDPIALSYILDATGPVGLDGPESLQIESLGLPTELNGQNVVPTLLSSVYDKIEDPALQDAYFASVAKTIFSTLSNGGSDTEGLLGGISQGVKEGRILVWSADGTEQALIAKYPLSGSIAGPSISPAQFGLYFNDGTGAKMDYYVKHTVQLVKECPADGYEQTTVRVRSTNTAPADAATALPTYVTGAGIFGVPPGSVQTNIVAYGPTQATIEHAKVNGERTEFAPYIHADRPLGVVAQRLAPGESKTVEFTFGNIVQHVEPNLSVTPTVQAVKDVIMPTESAVCR